jgi:hypothetical protein
MDNMSEEVTMTEEEITFVIDTKKILPVALRIVSDLDTLSTPERAATLARVLIAYYGKDMAMAFAAMIVDLIPQIVEQDAEFAKKASELPDDKA